MTITGVLRTPTELLPLGEASSGPALLTRPGFLGREGSSAPGLYSGIAVWLRDGDADGLVGRLSRRLDQLVVSYPLIPPDEGATIIQATDFESRAGAAIAGSGRARRPVLRRSGGQPPGQERVARRADPRDPRADPARPAGRVGPPLAPRRARRGAADAGGHGGRGVDARPPGRGSAGRVGPHAALRLAGVDPRCDRAVRAGRAGRIVRLTAGPGDRRGPFPAPFGASSPSLATGLGLAWHSVRRGATLPLVSAVAASAIAVAAIVTAAGGTASLRLVTDEPHRFGAPWDAIAQIRQ